MKVQIPISTQRHSAAHLFAAALLRLYPTAKFGVGPDIDNGFYYDFKIPGLTLGFEEMKGIQKEMERMRKQKIPYVRKILPMDDAIEFMKKHDQDFKVELLTLLKTKGSTLVAKETGDANVASGDGAEEIKEVSFYTTGEFIDLCRGPHVEHSGQTGFFKLHQITSAYWRGNAENESMQRIYGLCFPSKEELRAEETRLVEAKARDHRTLNSKFNFFTFSDDVGRGLPLWMNNGTAVRSELEYIIKEVEREYKYTRVLTPVIGRQKLYYKSGHLPYYQDDMYRPIDIEGDPYMLKPMNCPHHHSLYNAQVFSYRDLPIRMAEFGHVHRFEQSGALSGLHRTRGFTQNDAHIYCSTPEQAKVEFIKVMHLSFALYKMLDIGDNDFYMQLSLPDMNKLEKYVDQPENWRIACDLIREAMTESGYKFIEVEGEAAFYGPKVDFMIRSSIGSEYAISTNQLDFVAPQKFNLKYKASDSTEKPVAYVIHRTPLGSFERVFAFVVEHYAAKFPTWLAPVQLRILPISEKVDGYAQAIEDKIRAVKVHNGTMGIRVETDLKDDTIQKKILRTQKELVPVMMILGEKEMETNTVSLRLRDGDQINFIQLDDAIARIKYEAEERKPFPHPELQQKEQAENKKSLV